MRSSLATLQVVEPEAGASYTLESVVHHTGIPRRRILLYCRAGLLSPKIDPELGRMSFDDEAIYTIRTIEQLRAAQGIGLNGARIILDLTRELERLRRELRFR